jgi:outer membrane receptor protein involved in Fe transport
VKNLVLLKINTIKIFITFAFLTTNVLSFSGTTISGFVYDNENGEALIGANVYLENSSSGTSTNLNGYYVLTDVPTGRQTIICQYIGYATYKKFITIEINENKKVNIIMKPAMIESEEIVVVADSLRTVERLYNKPISQIGITPREIRQIPQVIEADLMRTLQSLPGILPVSDYSSQLYIRGGTPDQNLFLMDGADVYNPEHAFGLFSTFNTDAIKDVEVSKGGFSAPYGGRLSSIINVTNLDGNRKEFEGNASISLLSAKSTVQFPLGKFGSLSASIRRTYMDQTFGRYYDEVPDYYFYDGHVKAFFDINPSNKLTVATYYGRDVLDFEFDPDNPDTESLLYNWGNTTGSVRWTHIFTPQLFSNFWITYSDFSSKFKFEELNEDNFIKDVAFKGNFEYAFSKRLSAVFGYEFKKLDYAYQQKFPGGTIDVVRGRYHYIGYASFNYSPYPRLSFDLGLRYNYFDSNVDYKNWAPRFSGKFRLSETSNLKFSTGLYHQYLHRIPRAFVADIWTTADENYKNSSAAHYILGYQKEVAKNIEFEVESYYKQYYDIYSLKSFLVDLEPQEYDNEGMPVYKETTGLFDRGDGYSAGIEFLFRKKLGPLTGWIAYALSHTEYTADNVNHGKAFTPRHDRTSVINTVMNIELKNLIRDMLNRPQKKDRGKWLLGMNFIYSTGQPITLTSSTYTMSPFPDRNLEEVLLYPSSRNKFRLPPYIRMDLSITYERQYNGWTMIPFFQFFNIGNRKNVWFINYTDEEDTDNNRVVQDIETINMFPLLPTLGVTVRF